MRRLISQDNIDQLTHYYIYVLFSKFPTNVRYVCVLFPTATSHSLVCAVNGDMFRPHAGITGTPTAAKDDELYCSLDECTIN